MYPTVDDARTRISFVCRRRCRRWRPRCSDVHESSTQPVPVSIRKWLRRCHLATFYFIMSITGQMVIFSAFCHTEGERNHYLLNDVRCVCVCVCTLPVRNMRRAQLIEYNLNGIIVCNFVYYDAGTNTRKSFFIFFQHSFRYIRNRAIISTALLYPTNNDLSLNIQQ